MIFINKINCLDHGYVKLLNISGAIDRKEGEFSAKDIDPAICARISFDNFEEERTEEQDMKLVEYLIANAHTSPFEMTQTWWQLKVPMFLGEQILRHRTASFNKVSGRYSTFDEEWYIPERVGGKAVSNKQGQEDNLHIELQEMFKIKLKLACQDSYNQYLHFLYNGVAPEHARLFLHANHYTTMLMRIDLHNLMHFLALRLDSHAQIEARIYAQAIYDLLSLHLPKTMLLFDKYKR